MLFDCTDPKGSIPSFRSWRRVRKGAAALALAVAAAAPIVALPSLSRANEFEEALVLLAEQAKPTDAELLSKGAEQYNQGKYEDAQITLQQIKADGLSPGDAAKLTDTMRKVESAASQRQAARAAFLKGEEAATAKNYDEAIKQYRAASDKKFADAATREKAAAQLAVAQAAAKPAAFDKNAYFKEAIADYKAGRLDVAREKFAKLDQMGFRGGLFDTRPKEYIQQIDKKLTAQAAAKVQPKGPEPVPPTVQPNGTQVAAKQPTTAPVPVARIPGKDAYDQGVEAYRKGDLATARVRFAEAQSDGYVPPAQFDPPARYIAMIEQKEAATQPAPVKPGPVVARTTQPAPAGISAEEQALRATANIATAREQFRQYEVQVLVQRARQAQEDNRLTEAYQAYKQARDIDPNNKEAAQGTARLQAMIVGAPQQNLLEAQMALIQPVKDADRYYFNQAIAEAKAAINAGQFTRVPELIDRALAARNAHAELFSREELARFDEQLRGVREASQEAQLAVQKQRDEEQRRTVLDEQRLEQDRIRQARREKIMDLTQKSKQFIHDRNYVDALKTINQILALDPTNDWAAGVKRLVQDNAVIQEQRRVREDLDRNFEQQLDRAEEAKIPYLDTIKYPDNWPEISEMRDRQVSAERRGAADELGPRAALDMKLPDVKFRGQAFAEAVEWFRDMTNANIFVHWAKLEAAGIQPTSKLHDIVLHNVKFEVALNKVLTDVGGPVKLGYTVEDGMITITTAEELASNTVLRVYDIRDLLIVPPEPAAAQPTTIRERMQARDRERALARSPYSSFGPTVPVYSGGQMGTSPNNGYSSGMIEGAGLTDAQKADHHTARIIDVIKKTIDRDSWVDSGGKIGDIQFIQGQLAVTQTPENQRQVAGLLDRLRELTAIQVAIEARFLTIQRNYLEDIGVDIDFFFNINNPQQWSPISVSQQSADFTSGTAAATAAPGTIAGATGGLKPAITIGGSFLDDYQVNFLIRATQANRHSTIMTAPRVTVWNGQLASITVGTEQAYVSDLDAVTSGGSLYGAVAYNPVVDTILSGVSLAVRPTVSADRKYVTLSMSPTLSQLVDLVTFAVTAVNNNGNVNNAGVPTGQATQSTGVGNIQLPLTQITTLQTIVTVPDGGTLLLGGQTIAGEVEIEEGVPILSKIPFLKRLFTNRSTAKDEQVLLILVRPTILIQREMEQIQFPLLNTRTRSQ